MIASIATAPATAVVARRSAGPSRITRGPTIRAAVTAGVNITYKVLVNGAVAMTGGQPIEGEPLEGEVTVPEIVAQLAAEGVKRIAVVSDDPERYGREFGRGTSIHHRSLLLDL